MSAAPLPLLHVFEKQSVHFSLVKVLDLLPCAIDAACMYKQSRLIHVKHKRIGTLLMYKNPSTCCYQKSLNMLLHPQRSINVTAQVQVNVHIPTPSPPHPQRSINVTAQVQVNVHIPTPSPPHPQRSINVTAHSKKRQPSEIPCRVEFTDRCNKSYHETWPVFPPLAKTNTP